MNDWQKKFDESNTYEDIDKDIIQSLITGCISVVKTSESQDRQGVDYIVKLRRGAPILLDVKRRELGASRHWRDGPELPLEIYSVMPGGKFNTPSERQKTGWMLDESSIVDFILFAFHPHDSSEVFLVPFQPLRMAFIKNFNYWKKRYYLKEQESRDKRTGIQWQSQCVFVPASAVMNEIHGSMRYVVDPIETAAL